MEVKIKRNQNPGGKEGLINWQKKVRKHINILEHHQRGDKEERKIWGTWKEVQHKEKRNKNSDRRAETVTPCKNSKAEEI